MSAGVLDRTVPGLDDSPPINMPPMNVIKCQCEESCPLSGPCELEATGDDLLCEVCRKAVEAAKMARDGVFSVLNPYEPHCHKCDPEFEKDGDDCAPS